MGIDLPLCSEDVNEALQNIIANENFKNPKLSFKSGSKVGEGYLGINSAVEISDSHRTLNLFMKAAPKEVMMRKLTHIREAYKNEYHFYTAVYPSIDAFYKSKTGKSLNLVPKLYAANIQEMKELFVLENLSAQGFALNDGKSIFSRHQVILIMREYGKFHAISFAMKDQKGELFTELSKNLPQLVYRWLRGVKVASTVRRECKAMEKYYRSSDDQILLEKFKYISENLEHYLLKFKTFDGEPRVIAHGDCNYNNMMFRNKENNLEVRFLDFQGTTLSSPVMDLVYFFYGSASSEENLADLDFFLNVYYDSLSNTMRELGSDPEKLCPLSVVKEHWKMFSVFGLIIAFVTVAMMVDEAEAAVTILEAMGSDVSDYKNKQDPSKNAEEYARRIKYIIKHFVDNRFISKL